MTLRSKSQLPTFCPKQSQDSPGQSEWPGSTHSRQKKRAAILYFSFVSDFRHFFGAENLRRDSPWSSCEIAFRETGPSRRSGSGFGSDPALGSGSRAFFVGGGESLRSGDDAILTKLRVPTLSFRDPQPFEGGWVDSFQSKVATFVFVVVRLLTNFFLFRLRPPRTQNGEKFFQP